MGRRRRAREPPARLVLLALALASGSALLLASLSLLLAAWPRSGARPVQEDAAAAAAAGPQVRAGSGGRERAARGSSGEAAAGQATRASAPAAGQGLAARSPSSGGGPQPRQGRTEPALPAPASGHLRRAARAGRTRRGGKRGAAAHVRLRPVRGPPWRSSSAHLLTQAETPEQAAAGELLSEGDVEQLDPVVLSTSWNHQGKFLHHFAQQGALRHRRQAEKGKRFRPCRTGTICAAHYEVQTTVGRAGMQADANGTIRGWAEAKLNATNPLRYDSNRGEFTVIKRGLYYLYCQVHFNEGKTIYMKLDVMLGGELALRCLEQFPPTSSGPQEAELRVCQVSGLVLLRPEESIRLRTIPRVRLKADRYLTYFGLFQVH
ncbi:tumor necrosis factor ligand superfamily member 12 [Candoia aspera]|uniref:tumor necrosis factor ligand superfamily member 12 n=1 Tax=Candoia aspera TaxID=51853 RepID=UPI002FD7EF55